MFDTLLGQTSALDLAEIGSRFGAGRDGGAFQSILAGLGDGAPQGGGLDGLIGALDRDGDGDRSMTCSACSAEAAKARSTGGAPLEPRRRMPSQILVSADRRTSFAFAKS